MLIIFLQEGSFKELTRRCEAHLLYYLIIVEVGCLCFNFFCLSKSFTTEMVIYQVLLRD